MRAHMNARKKKHTHVHMRTEFEHLDFIWAMEARARVYEPLLSQLLDAVAEGGR